jgi:DNA invertase Pin-like site-specific DNA recombinase
MALAEWLVREMLRDKAYLDLTSTMGKGILAFLSALAQDERERILMRAQDGRRAARPVAPGAAASLN